jgi:hypothetical protein
MDLAREEVQRIARQVQEQVQSHARGGDWQAGLREGLAELTRELGRFGAHPAPDAAAAQRPAPEADDTPPSQDPLRDLERLLDRFRDDVRDTARDSGVTDPQLREVRHHLTTAATRITASLRPTPEPKHL